MRRILPKELATFWRKISKFWRMAAPRRSDDERVAFMASCKVTEDVQERARRIAAMRLSRLEEERKRLGKVA
jgi:hypothetical protein